MAKRKTATATGEMTESAFNQSVSVARTLLIDRWPFIGYLALNLRPRMRDDIPTACVSLDGALSLNPEFWQSLTPQEQVGVIAHEVLHPALMCWARQGERKELVVINGSQVISLWNLAHDFSFNLMIKDFGDKSKLLKLPEGCAVDERFRDKSAEEVYDILQAEAAKRPKVNGMGSLPYACSTGNDIEEGGCDTAEGARAEAGDAASRRKLETDWKVNVCTAAQMQEKQSGQGSLPSWIQRLVSEITSPKLDWREEMSRWVGENGPRGDYSFRRPSRRSQSVGIYLPRLTKGDGVADEITILIDTSGSISRERLTMFLSEIQGICDDLGITVRVIVIDADIHDDLEINDVRDAIASIKGGGGSDFTPAFRRLEEEAYDGCVVAFTDGMISVPAVMPPTLKGVLWVLGGQNEKSPATWGETVHAPFAA